MNLTITESLLAQVCRKDNALLQIISKTGNASQSSGNSSLCVLYGSPYTRLSLFLHVTQALLIHPLLKSHNSHP